MYGMNYPFIGAQVVPSAPFMGQGMQTPVPAIQPPQSGPAFLQVGTVKEFDSVTIQPGRQALIMAQNDPYIAFKNADNMGQVTTNYYKLEPVTVEQINGPAPEYVTKQEFQQTIQQLIDGLTPKKAVKKEGAE